jgi:hypothetical protein
MVKQLTSEISQLMFICSVPHQTLGEGNKYIVLSAAYQRDTVLRVSSIAKFVNALSSGIACLTLLVQHNLDEFGNFF